MGVRIGSRCFDLAPGHFLVEEAGSVNAFRLTMRAADVGESPRFLGMFLACAGFRFESESTLRPLAGNAHR